MPAAPYIFFGKNGSWNENISVQKFCHKSKNYVSSGKYDDDAYSINNCWLRCITTQNYVLKCYYYLKEKNVIAL